MNTTVSLVVSTYNWPEALEHVLLSAFEQSVRPTEIIVADDGSGIRTRELIERFQKISPMPLKHLWHEDQGFRRTAILNKAIKNAVGDYIIQTDGDCILSRQFVKDHLTMATPGLFLYGTRVRLSQHLFERRIKQGKKFRVNFFDPTLSKRFRMIYLPLYSRYFTLARSVLSKKLRGCNMSYWKEDFFQVNGYNEEITGWGREDSELAIRLLNKGLKAKRIKFQAIVYHIDHPERDKKSLSKNDAVQTETLENKTVYCQKGLFEKQTM